MFKFNEDEENLKCSFCGKDQDQVKKLVAGSGVYIVRVYRTMFRNCRRRVSSNDF